MPSSAGVDDVPARVVVCFPASLGAVKIPLPLFAVFPAEDLEECLECFLHLLLSDGQPECKRNPPVPVLKIGYDPSLECFLPPPCVSPLLIFPGGLASSCPSP